MKIYVVVCGGENRLGDFVKVLGAFSTEERARQEAKADFGCCDWQIVPLMVDDVSKPGLPGNPHRSEKRR